MSRSRQIIEKQIDEMKVESTIKIPHLLFIEAYPITKELQDHVIAFIDSRHDPWVDFVAWRNTHYYEVKKVTRKTKRIPKEEPANLDLNWHD